MLNERLQYLFRKCLDKTATVSERSELDELLNSDENKHLVEGYIAGILKEPKIMQAIPDATMESIIKAIVEADKEPKEVSGVRRVRFINLHWFKYAAAAILFIAAAGVYFRFIAPRQGKVDVVVNPVLIKNDVLPGGDKAILTLSNGNKVLLGNGDEVLNDAGVRINKSNGELVYGPTNIMAFNVMTTPRGGQYKLTLPDGTKVWLNAASSITFPTSFAAHERNVTMSGEAYFEVSKDATKPFYVKIDNGTQVEVLGTTFNINAYPEEGPAVTTLVEGSVKLKHQNKYLILQPGQQVKFDQQHFQISNPDLSKVLAWTKGFFNFDDTRLPTIMRQISRWYDVDILYEGKITDEKFGGQINRKLPLSSILKLIKTNGVNFQLQGKT